MPLELLTWLKLAIEMNTPSLFTYQHRSTQRLELVRSTTEMGLRQRMRALAVKYPRYGYRRVHVILLRDGYQVNRQRVQHPKRRKPKIARVPIVVRG